MADHLSSEEKEVLGLADTDVVIGALSRLRNQPCPPWLSATNSYPDGTIPNGRAAFESVSNADMLEVIAVRGPLHAIDGWSYLGRAFSSLLSGQAHAARHLSYYAELRAALSILASSGIGVFNRRHAIVDEAGIFHPIADVSTHQMAWLALAEWSKRSASLERLIKPIQLAGVSLIDPFREFFPANVSTAAGQLMVEWGFDLQQGMLDRDERNWSSYQPTALGPIVTAPRDDAAFLQMFWAAFRPNGVELERHLLRILLEKEARSHSTELTDYECVHERLQEGTKSVLSYDFLTRVAEPTDHDFIIHVADQRQPTAPYAMMCRAGLLLKLATGMAEENLRTAGVQPFHDISNWWLEFGANHGLWHPARPPESSADLWDDIDLSLEDAAAAPTGHRFEWISALGHNAVRVCETERVALWSLFP